MVEPPMLVHERLVPKGGEPGRPAVSSWRHRLHQRSGQELKIWGWRQAVFPSCAIGLRVDGAAWRRRQRAPRVSQNEGRVRATCIVGLGRGPVAGLALRRISGRRVGSSAQKRPAPPAQLPEAVARPSVAPNRPADQGNSNALCCSRRAASQLATRLGCQHGPRAAAEPARHMVPGAGRAWHTRLSLAMRWLSGSAVTGWLATLRREWAPNARRALLALASRETQAAWAIPEVHCSWALEAGEKEPTASLSDIASATRARPRGVSAGAELSHSGPRQQRGAGDHRRGLGLASRATAAGGPGCPGALQ